MIRTDLRKIRKKLGQTQKQFALTFNVPQSFISQIENGIDPMPAAWLPKLTQMLGVCDLSEFQLATSNKNQKEDVISRLRIFFESTGLPQGRIAMQCGFTAKMLHNILKGEGRIDLSIFLGLINAFGDLNINWLLTGKGDMLINTSTASLDIDRIATLVDTIATLQKAISDKDNTIGILANQVQQLKNQLNK